MLPTKAHARVGSQHERKADNIGDGGTPQAEGSGGSPSKLQDGEHNVGGNRSPTHDRLTLLEVRLHLAIAATQARNRMPDGWLGEAQIRVPRVDGRDVRLQAACGYTALLPQISQICKQVCGAGGEGGDRRLAALLLHPRTEIKPALQLAGIAAQSRRATASNKELRGHLFAREVLRQLA